MKLVEAGSEGVAGQDSDVFKAEVVQHLLTLQVSHPQLREAIQEVQTCLLAPCCTSALLLCVVQWAYIGIRNWAGRHLVQRPHLTT